MASLLEINILSHYYAFRRDYDGRSEGSPAHQHTIKKFLLLGLLEMNHSDVGGIFRITAVGKMYIERLKSIPLPDVRISYEF
jgi:hypothetical protein